MSSEKIKLFRGAAFLGLRRRAVIEALYARGLVTLERNAKGYVVAAHERHVSHEQPLEPKAATNSSNGLRPTRYSFEDSSVEGRPWDLKRLNGKRAGLNYAPESLRPIFCRVVLECLA